MTESKRTSDDTELIELRSRSPHDALEYAVLRFAAAERESDEARARVEELEDVLASVGLRVTPKRIGAQKERARIVADLREAARTYALHGMQELSIIHMGLAVRYETQQDLEDTSDAD